MSSVASLIFSGAMFDVPSRLAAVLAAERTANPTALTLTAAAGLKLPYSCEDTSNALLKIGDIELELFGMKDIYVEPNGTDSLFATVTCLYLGNTSCFARPATLTKLPMYSGCDDGSSILLNLVSALNTTATTPVSNSATSTTSYTTSQQVSTTSSPKSTLPSPISSSSGAQATMNIAISATKHTHLNLRDLLTFWIISGIAASSSIGIDF